MKGNKIDPHSWGTSAATYVSQVPELTCKDSKGKRRNAGFRKTRSQFIRKCKRYICINRKDGSLTTGIVFPNGTVYVGDDVWRMSNRADCCEYPIKHYKSLKFAEMDYDFDEAKRSFLTAYGSIKEGRHPTCV